MNKVVEYIIGAKDATGNAIKSALSRLKSFASSVGSNLQNIRAGLGMLRTAVTQAMSVMAKAFAFEKMTVQFKTLVGSMDEARAHMRMLQELGDTPPFSLEEFAAASRQMLVMSDGALGFKKSLELVGDAAAATGQPIQNLAHEIGRAYAIIRDGQPLTRATMGLRNMGAITPEVAAKLDELQKSGATNFEIWNALTAELGKFKGAMAETEKTGDGLIGAIKSQWDDTLRDLGAAFLETSKGGLAALLDMMKNIREDGSLAVWAEDTVEWLREVYEGAKAVLGPIGKLLSFTWKGIKGGYQAQAQAIGNFVGTLAGGGGIGEAFKQGWSGFKQGWIDAYDLDGAEEDHRERRKEQKRREREAKLAKEAAAKKQSEDERIQKQLEEAQKKIDQRKAEEQAKADAKAAAAAAKAAEKAAKEEERMRLALEREIAKERERLWKADLKAQEAEYRRAQTEESAAQARLSAATANEQRAWGWYRDRDSWKAQLAEEKAEAEAQKQFEKDFANLKRFRSDWRTSDRLSDEDELIRRVALAREERAAAENYARQTAEATQRAADALDAIQQTLESEEY